MKADGIAKQIVCPNCAAVFSADEACCPYCGDFNPTGAEKAYMEELDDIRRDTGELAQDAQEGFAANLQRNTKRTITIAILVIAALITLFALVNCMNSNEERRALQDYQAREAFRTQYFAEFDRLYEAGDDDALSDYAWNLTDDPGFDALFSWEHADFLAFHDGWATLRSAEADIAAGTCGIDDYTYLVELALRLVQLDESDRLFDALSPEEEERAAGYRTYAWQFLEETLQMDRDEITAFAKAAEDAQGFVETGKLRQELENRLRHIGTLG